MATNTRQNERAPKIKRPLREVWKSTKLTPVEKVMLWLGWVPADITRHITCTWCGADFTYTGKVTDDPPRFCNGAHKRASTKERTKRLSGPRIEPGVEAVPTPPVRAIAKRGVPPKGPSGGSDAIAQSKPKCRCYGHTGKAKQKYPTNAAAAIGMMKNHLKYADGRIYKCPTSNYWHITTQLVRKASR